MDNKPPALSRRLSGIDAAFLYLERKEIPLNIACVAIFDGPIPFREFVANIDSKLDLIPRYRQLAVPPPLNVGYPTWEFDPNFDIKHHIFRVRLKAPGGEAELEALAGRLLSQMLDRGKPLWEMHVVEGLADGRGALIVRIHHALADGVAGAALLRVMLDPSPDSYRAVHKPRTRPRVPPRVEPTLTEQVASAIQSALENVVAAEAGLLSLTEGLLSDHGKNALQELATLLPELLKPAERFVFNKPCSGERKFCWVDVDFGELQAIRAAVGGKVNDCVLSVVVRAIARYIRLHGEKVNGRLLRVAVPVNLRAGEQGESLGNRITFLPVILPLDVRDPVKMLHAVASRMEIMKGARAADLLAIFASCLGTAPTPMQEVFWRVLPLVPLPIPLLNLICTNVPGPPMPLYSIGRRLVAFYPQVPTGYELGLGVAVQSYDGKLCFGVTADANVAPDAARLRDYIRICFGELSKAAGVRSANPRGGGARKRTQPARSAEPAESSITELPEKPVPAPRAGVEDLLRSTSVVEERPAGGPAADQGGRPTNRPVGAPRVTDMEVEESLKPVPTVEERPTGGSAADLEVRPTEQPLPASVVAVQPEPVLA